jgi:hypothetical protein
MERKSLSSKWKVIICCLALIIGMATTGITVWAIARNYFRYNAAFEVNITGGRDVYATVEGSTYNGGSSTVLESHTATFNASTATTDTNMSFTSPISMQNDEQIAKVGFVITNNSPYSNHTDLIIKPSIEKDNIDDVIITWYYSTNDTNYDVYTGEYLVAHKDTPIYLELRMLATVDMFGEVNLKNSVSIVLKSELNKPTDFEWEYSITYNETNPYVTKQCPTCGENLDVEYLQSEDIVIINNDFVDSNDNYTCHENFENKYIFLEIMSSGNEINFTGTLTNVTISTLLALQGTKINLSSGCVGVTFRQIIFNNYSVGRNAISAYNCTNIKIIDCTFTDCMEIGDFTGSYNVTIKDCSFTNSSSDITYVFSNINNLRLDGIKLNSAIDFAFYTVENIVLTDCVIYYNAIAFDFASGEILIVNNNNYNGYIFAHCENANILIENNNIQMEAYCAELRDIINCRVEITNNYNGGYEDYATTHKLNDETIETSIYLGGKASW